MTQQLSFDDITRIVNAANKKHKPKIASPSTFDGKDGEKVTSWLDEMDCYIDYNNDTLTTEEEKLKFVISYLKDGARDWWASIKKTTNKPTTWALFSKSISKSYTSPDRVLLARQALYNLKQGKLSVKQYTDQFRALVLRIGDEMSEQDKQFQYVHNLSSTVRQQVLLAKCDTWIDAQEAALRVGSVQQVISTVSNDTAQPMDLSSMLQSILSEDGGAMELSAMINNYRNNNNRVNTQQRRKKLNIERSEYKRRRDNNLCLGCGDSKHRIAQCPNFQ